MSFQTRDVLARDPIYGLTYNARERRPKKGTIAEKSCDCVKGEDWWDDSLRTIKLLDDWRHQGLEKHNKALNDLLDVKYEQVCCESRKLFRMKDPVMKKKITQYSVGYFVLGVAACVIAGVILNFL